MAYSATHAAQFADALNRIGSYDFAEAKLVRGSIVCTQNFFGCALKFLANNEKPSRDWLEFVKTSIAKKHIRSALKHSRPAT